MKRLIYDIEVTPDIGTFWQPSSKALILYQNILKERVIICISYKWEGEKKIYNLFWDKNWNDKQIIKQFIKILKEADEIVAHNGDQFDLKWIRARALRFGIDLAFPIITHDTLKIARQKFRFNSNRLDYLAQFLGVGGKLKTDNELWQKVAITNQLRKALGLPLLAKKEIDKANKKMIRYCNNDVKILEDVWLKLKPYATQKLSVSENRIKCPECGGNTVKHRERILASGAKKVIIQCKKCSKYHTVPKSTYVNLLKSS